MVRRLRGDLASKWKKHLILSTHMETKSHLPSTNRLSKASLQHYLRDYSTVFLKPERGTGGRGIYKLIHRDGNVCVYCNRSKKVYNNKEDVLRVVQREAKKRTYLVQQGIGLLKVMNRPVDFRIILVRPDEEWKYMGVIGKVASKNKFVTNKCQGGSPITLSQALLRNGRTKAEVADVSERLETLGLQVAQRFSEASPAFRKLGLDVGIDRQGKIWILEVNTVPRYKLFKYHPDQTLYGKIHRSMMIIRSRRRRSR
ncbi:YheC/YheD family protein [Caldalkalibacillus salinus]|uniref:YheC/YheD family protein n=1 Tax=Caldalkalibacillus salinus TaxID=2803787 RepID=UPI001923D623|nr:YheC/YheD family protein [Caldalkalibacillus salinus]